MGAFSASTLTQCLPSNSISTVLWGGTAQAPEVVSSSRLLTSTTLPAAALAEPSGAANTTSTAFFSVAGAAGRVAGAITA